MAALSYLCSPHFAPVDIVRIAPRTPPHNAARAVPRTSPRASFSARPLALHREHAQQQLAPFPPPPSSPAYRAPRNTPALSPRSSPPLRASASAQSPEGGAAPPGGTPAPAIRFRPATPADMGTIQRLVLSEFMNPLSLDVRRFVVAEAAAAAAAAAAAGEGAGGAGKGEVEAGWRLVGAGQMKEWKPEGGVGAGAGPLMELRSLVVLPEMRGHGIGSKLVSELLKSVQGRGAVHLLTIGARTAFYERHGFHEVSADAVPSQLQLELFLGSFVASFAAGDRCLCMKAVV
ncbi:hypothetical protein CLOM_g23296 [Closterium sp. NIES-68]|nr:hypothetical protein CLOM_g23296 [Closterium sp. NIES-68]